MNNPPLRKRSEIGKAKGQTQVGVSANIGDKPQESFEEFEPHAPTRTAPAMENISEFVASLKEVGIDVSLLVAAAWGPEQREKVRAWRLGLDAAASPVQSLPECLLPYRLSIKRQGPDAKALQERLFVEGGLHVTMANVEGFSQMQRDVAIAWVEQGATSSSMPEFLSEYLPPPQVVLSLDKSPVAKQLVEGMRASIAQVQQGFAQVVQEVVPQVDALMDATVPENPLHALPSDEWKKRVPSPRESSSDLGVVVSESVDYNKLVCNVLRKMNIDREYEELEQLLEVGDNRRDYATVYEALDKAERRALRAHGIWAAARLEHERLKLDQAEVDASLWKQAREALEMAQPEEEPTEEEPTKETKGKKEKKPAARRKMITNLDVESKIAELFPDEWRGGKLRLERSKITVERCERFSELWSQKVRSLNTMLSSVRK